MNKNKKNKLVSGRTSLRGKKGTVGAPTIPVKFPTVPFTMAKLFAINSKGKYKQCQLSVRTKVDELVVTGKLISLKPRKQAKGTVGRPAPMYVLKSSFNPAKMVTAPPPVKTGHKEDMTAAVSVETPAPVIVPETDHTITIGVPTETPALASVVAEVTTELAPVVNEMVPA